MTELEAIRQRAASAAPWKQTSCCLHDHHDTAPLVRDLDALLKLLDEHHEKYDRIFWSLNEDKPCPVCEERV